MIVLVVEDQAMMREILVQNLLQQDHQVYAYASAEAAMETQADWLDAVDVAVLDISLPGLDGFALSKHLRQIKPSLLIIILTMHEALETKFKSLEAGANLYLTKPVDPKALSQAMHDLKQETQASVTEIPALTLDTIKQRLYKQGDSVKLTTNEARMMALFVSQDGPVEHWQLMEVAQLAFDGAGKKYLEVLISRLRQKLRRFCANTVRHPPEMIESVRGQGYQLNIDVTRVNPQEEK